MPTITGELTCSVDDGQGPTASKDFPSGAEDGKGTLGAGGREWEFQHVSIGNPQCAIVVDAEELDELDLGAIGPEIEGHELFPNRTNVSFLRDRRQPGAGADLRARGGGDALLRHRRQRRRGHRLPARCRRARSSVELDGGELEVEIGEDLDGAPDRLGRAGLRGRALAGAAAGAAELDQAASR